MHSCTAASLIAHLLPSSVLSLSATGSGIALDARLRGLSVALVDAADFSSGASSRSTKLIHGGIRYLQKAFTQLDAGQYSLVKEALTERHHLLSIAPHLAHAFPIIVPIYSSFPAGVVAVPYYWLGCKLYDTVAGTAATLAPSYFLPAAAALRKFPMLRADGLWGGMVYYDGQHNDTRMNISIVLTAAALGANVANHCRAIGLLREGGGQDGRVTGARLRDELTGEEWPVRAREVINATGPLTDAVRRMADPSSASCITPSAGIHIVLPGSYAPPDMGLIVPETSDGRVLFLLPWEGSTIVGTTDYLSPVTALPSPHEADVSFLLREASTMLSRPIRREDIRSVWSGIRPLARDPKAKSTEAVSRDHMIENTCDGLLTISGGKWTTYRKMAEDVLNVMLKGQQRLRAEFEQQQQSGGSAAGRVQRDWLIDTRSIRPCSSWGFPLIGTRDYSEQLAQQLTAAYGQRLPQPSASSLSVVRHLTHNYGDRAPLVLGIAAQRGDFSLLHLSHPFLTAETLYACQYEMAQRAVDVLAHRTRLCFLDTEAASEAAEKVVEDMSAYYGWGRSREKQELQDVQRFLDTMRCTETLKQQTPHSLRPAHAAAEETMAVVA